MLWPMCGGFAFAEILRRYLFSLLLPASILLYNEVRVCHSYICLLVECFILNRPTSLRRRSGYVDRGTTLAGSSGDCRTKEM